MQYSEVTSESCGYIFVHVIEGHPYSPQWATAVVIYVLAVSSVVGGVKLAPTENSPIFPGQTLIYCPTFLAAWRELSEEVGGPVGMEDATRLVEQLNKAELPTNTIPAEAYVAIAGRIDQGIIERLREALQQQFGASSPALPADLAGSQTELIAYCHLQRLLPFPRRFIRSRRLPLPFKTDDTEEPVHFFGVTEKRADDYSHLVDIMHWRNELEFTLRLKTKRNGESVVLARMMTPKHLSDAISRVRDQLEADRPPQQGGYGGRSKQRFLSHLSEGDLLAIPVLDLSVATNYSALCNRKLTNKGREHLHLGAAHQDIAFRMDEYGAVVRSTAYAIVDFGGPMHSAKPRRFVFDRPFLLCLWRKGADSPYVAMWVGSTDVMLPFKPNTERPARR